MEERSRKQEGWGERGAVVQAQGQPQLTPQDALETEVPSE